MAARGLSRRQGQCDLPDELLEACEGCEGGQGSSGDSGEGLVCLRHAQHDRDGGKKENDEP
jgi:hypothetical protein